MAGSMAHPASREELQGVGRPGPLLGSTSWPTLRTVLASTQASLTAQAAHSLSPSARRSRPGRDRPAPGLTGPALLHPQSTEEGLLPSQRPTATQGGPHGGSPRGPGSIMNMAPWIRC